MYPPLDAATNLVPSEDDATEYQEPVPAPVRAVQLTPESAEVYRDPLLTPAIRFEPSAEEAIESHARWPAPSCSVQVAPELFEV